MTKVHHFDCVDIETPDGAKAIGHCLLLEDTAGLAIVDAGLGLLDVLQPEKRLGQSLIEAVGFRLHPDQPLVVQMAGKGWDPAAVKYCIASHLDIDHISGIDDFTGIQIHVSREEWENFIQGNPRYGSFKLSGDFPVRTYGPSAEQWRGVEARKLALGFASEIYLIPLFGHTRGHCGIAIQQEDHWIFYTGDAYYYRIELEKDDHPVSQLAAQRADDNEHRILSLEKIRAIVKKQGKLEMFSFHDPLEFTSFVNHR